MTDGLAASSPFIRFSFTFACATIQVVIYDFHEKEGRTVSEPIFGCQAQVSL
jgi:hypothetical protein